MNRPTVSSRRLKDENSALLRDDLARGADRLRGLPEVVTLNHTDLCNLRCIMCPRHLAQGTHRLSTRVLGYLADELFPTARKLVLTTSGGEPLVADFEFLLERSLRHGVLIDAVTNGVLLKPALYAEAAPALDHLNVSLDCHVPEVYARIREGARLEQVERNLEGIRDHRRRRPDDVLYSTSAVVMRSNLPHLPAFVRYAAALDFDAVVLQRLLHTVKPTPDEEPETHLDPVELAWIFAETEEAARAVGVNLYRTEFGLPPVLVRDLRSKRPDPILDRRLCWFMAQNFGVMYTGEVYPCCIPTDHLLGNVLYEDPVEIWNGHAARALRRAQRSGRGTLFCSGCLHAPHLAPPRLPRVAAALRVARRAIRHGVGRVSRRVHARLASPIFEPPPPRATVRGGAFDATPAPVLATPVPDLANDVATAGPDGAVWWVRDGLLRTAPIENLASARTVTRLANDPTPMATALRFAAPDVLLAAFSGGGTLLRVDLGGARPRVEEATRFSDPHATTRQPALAVHPDGTVTVGEYGIHPGARCGRVLRAAGARASFRELARLDWARHVHSIHPLPRGEVLVTTGDLASRRRLLRISAAGRVRTLERAWAGYTAIAETARSLHFGTDLLDRNALVRRHRSLRRRPERRALPDGLDLQVRDLVAVGGRLFALLGADADLHACRAGRRATVLRSDDDGETWRIVHRFAQDWTDAPEGLLPLDERRLLTVCSAVPVILNLDVPV